MAQTKHPIATDPEVARFEADLLESIRQMQAGEYAARYTAEMIKARSEGLGDAPDLIKHESITKKPSA